MEVSDLRRAPLLSLIHHGSAPRILQSLRERLLHVVLHLCDDSCIYSVHGYASVIWQVMEVFDFCRAPLSPPAYYETAPPHCSVLRERL